jgi:hypothetical protein
VLQRFFLPVLYQEDETEDTEARKSNLVPDVLMRPHILKVTQANIANIYMSLERRFASNWH